MTSVVRTYTHSILSSNTLYSLAHRLSIPAVLSTLRDLGIQSLMVEGGAQVIRSFFAESVVDVLIVTIAPIFVGADGVGYDLPSGTVSLGVFFFFFFPSPDIRSSHSFQDSVISEQS